MIKKYLCILNWSRFFIVFILMCIANIFFGIMFSKYYGMGATDFIILFLYVIIIVNSLLWYDGFYSSNTGMKVLEITPVNIEDVVRLYKYSKYITLFFTSLIGSFILLINGNKMGWFIIPNSLILLGINTFTNRSVERKKMTEDEEPVVAFLLSDIIMIIIYGIEFFFLLSVF